MRGVERGVFAGVEDAGGVGIEWGYRGWVSMELFNRSMMDPDEGVPGQHARRGAASWKKCMKALKLDEIEA